AADTPAAPPALTAASAQAAPAGAPASSERRHPLRFVWQMDVEDRFTLDSEEFVALIGPRTTAALGRPWRDIASALGLDPDGRVAHAIAARNTWRGLNVVWPMDGSPERLP